MISNRETLPVIPLRGLVVLPGEQLYFDASRPKSVEAAQYALRANSVVLLVSQMNSHKEDVSLEDVYEMGTLARIVKVQRIAGDAFRVIAQGLTRGKAFDVVGEEPYFLAEVERCSEQQYDPATAEALRRRIAERFQSYCDISGRVSAESRVPVDEAQGPGEYADAVAQLVAHSTEDKQDILEKTDVIPRLTAVHDLLGRELEILRADKRIAAQVRKQVDKSQKEYYLREQIRAINKELGNGESNVEAYRARMEQAQLPDPIREKLVKEIDRLESLPQGSHEAPVACNYIECILDLPWTARTADDLSLARARRILDENHYGMRKVKERVVESLAVGKLTGKLSGQILCFVGPPGVGKTSICASIAKALGRNFVRMSLGGVRDEAEIRGHRRTYIGAMPGRVIAAMRQAKSVNPLMLFDEIDKLGMDHRGDPAAAMLEVLDSAQNFAFTDHFLELPYDLSQVLFITTANSRDTIPAPLLDRMEIIEVDGYLEDEKVQIAQRHLLPKQMEKHGIRKGMLTIADAQVRAIISGYTAEPGVRELERCIAKICRKAACKIVEEPGRIRMSKQRLIEYLGQPKYCHEEADKLPRIGVVNGLAWTAAGGEMLVVEAQIYTGQGNLQLTGHLGDVMQESAKAALTYVRAHGEAFGLDPEFYLTKDVHVHVPEGATPKDGPSAGVTMLTAMMSAYTQLPIREGVAMTGEITLRGRVLAIGGLREKLLAAVRAGIHTVILPAANRKDLEEVPEAVQAALKLIFAEDVATVLRHALMQEDATAEPGLHLVSRGEACSPGAPLS